MKGTIIIAFTAVLMAFLINGEASVNSPELVCINPDQVEFIVELSSKEIIVTDSHGNQEIDHVNGSLPFSVGAGFYGSEYYLYKDVYGNGYLSRIKDFDILGIPNEFERICSFSSTLIEF